MLLDIIIGAAALLIGVGFASARLRLVRRRTGWTSVRVSMTTSMADRISTEAERRNVSVSTLACQALDRELLYREIQAETE